MALVQADVSNVTAQDGERVQQVVSADGLLHTDAVRWWRQGLLGRWTRRVVCEGGAYSLQAVLILSTFR